MTRAEYENTIRDLFQMPGLPLQGDLPVDGSAHGFDKNSDALDISHVNLTKYVEAADRTLDVAIATRPQPPTVTKQRISLAHPAVLIGPNNCGKTSAIQGIALWSLAVKSWHKSAQPAFVFACKTKGGAPSNVSSAPKMSFKFFRDLDFQ